MQRRTASVSDYKFLPVEINGDGNVVITIAGWIYDELDYSLPFVNMEAGIHGERYTLIWEEKALRALGKSMQGLAAEVNFPLSSLTPFLIIFTHRLQLLRHNKYFK